MTNEAIERAVALRRQQVSYRAIAAIMGWSLPTVLKHVRAAMGAEAGDCRRHGPKAARPVPAVRAAPTPRAVPPVPPPVVDHIWHELPASRTYHCATCGLEVRDPGQVEWTCAAWRVEQGQRRRGRALGSGGRVVG